MSEAAIPTLKLEPFVVPAPRPLEEFEALALHGALMRIDHAGFVLGSAHAQWDRLSEHLVQKAGADPKRFCVNGTAAREGRLEFLALPEPPPAPTADPPPAPGRTGAGLAPGTVMEDPHEINRTTGSAGPSPAIEPSGSPPPNGGPPS